MNIAPNHSSRWVAAFTLLSWLGEYVHNLVDLPQLTLFSPENSVPLLISLLLFIAWWLSPWKRLTTLVLLAWALVHLIGGGILSVIPFSFLPFYPAQTPLHYFMHVVYAAAQLPLVAAMLQELKQLNQKNRIVGAQT